jgi:hypothetical protein
MLARHCRALTELVGLCSLFLFLSSMSFSSLSLLLCRCRMRRRWITWLTWARWSSSATILVRFLCCDFALPVQSSILKTSLGLTNINLAHTLVGDERYLIPIFSFFRCTDTFYSLCCSLASLPRCCPKITSLNLKGTKISNRGLEYVSSCSAHGSFFFFFFSRFFACVTFLQLIYRIVCSLLTLSSFVSPNSGSYALI